MTIRRRIDNFYKKGSQESFRDEEGKLRRLVQEKPRADVLIAAIGFMSAAIVALIGLFGLALTIMLNKKSERKVELRKIKENQYIQTYAKMIKILFVCHGNINRYSCKACK